MVEGVFLSKDVTTVGHVAWHTDVAGKEGIPPLLKYKDCVIDMIRHEQYPGPGMPPMLTGILFCMSQAPANLPQTVSCCVFLAFLGSFLPGCHEESMTSWVETLPSYQGIS